MWEPHPEGMYIRCLTLFYSVHITAFQVEEEFWEELFLEACFEEMLAEEEAQWQHFQHSMVLNVFN